MNTVKVFYTEKHRLHRDPTGLHPESPWRVEEVLNVVKSKPIVDHVEVVDPPEPSYDILELAHSREYVEWVRNECSKGFHYIDADTYVNEYTCSIAASFANASWESAYRALNGEVSIILARPGGHHAGRSGRAMGAPTLGFCVFDYVSVASLELANRGYRVAVLDFDAHHGNGSQEILWNEPRVLHIDVHQWRIYPGTGWVTDIGGQCARGTKINIPLYRGSSDGEFTWVLKYIVRRAIDVFKPDVLVVFAGFDAHVEDPLTHLEVTEESYLNYGYYIGDLIRKNLVKGAVIVLGGGYGRGLVKGFEAFITGLLDLEKPRPLKPASPGKHIEDFVPTIFKYLEETTKTV